MGIPRPAVQCSGLPRQGLGEGEKAGEVQCERKDRFELQLG